ncbi:MAG: hypothetical protein J6W84_05530 [Bacteroidales bacterium]|nr:hypothetical protein [Bacteroidales bacterium]
MKTKLAETHPLSGTQFQEAPAPIDTSSQERVLGIIKSDSPIFNMGITPDIVNALVENKVSVLVQRGTGNCLFITDLEYADNGAEIYDFTLSITAHAHVIVKTSPITIEELKLMKTGQIIVAPFLPEDFSEAHHRLMSQKQLSAVAYNFIKNRDELPFLEAIAHKLPDELSKQKEFSNFFIPLISNLIFNKDIRTSIQTDPSILQGTYYYKGKLTNKSIAEEYGLPHRDILELCWNWN